MSDFTERRQAQLDAEPSGRLDPGLTFNLASVRNYFGVTYDSNNVIVDSLAADYMPEVLPTGDLIVSDVAISDFHETFDYIDVDTSALLVLYAGGRHALDVKRKESPRFHTRLGDIAVRRTAHLNLAKNIENRHLAEDMVIGWVSVYWAAWRVADAKDTKSERERVPAQIMAAADMRKPKHDISAYREERKPVMRHFASLPARIAEMAKTTVRAAQSL